MTTPKRRSVSKRTRIAHHEAGHAVLSASISDAPRLVSILVKAGSLGRARYQMLARPQVLIQIHLAGFAAEHILKGARPKQFVTGLGVCTTALVHKLHDSRGMVGSDEQLAIEEALKMGTAVDEDALKASVTRFYEISRESIISVWPAVRGVAKVLLKHGELDRDGFFEAIGSFDIYKPVRAVQQAHGLVPPQVYEFSLDVTATLDPHASKS